MLTENASTRVQTNQIADRLHTSAASVTDMIKKLSQKGMLEYAPYKGVKLTSEGHKAATALVRSHRLWEVFLVEKLGYDWADVHDIAEQLEHIKSDDLTDRLAHFLGNPHFDPHGDPIPDANGKYRLVNRAALNSILPKGRYILTGVKTHDKDFLLMLESYKIRLGTEMDLIERLDFDNSVRVAIADRVTIMPSTIASNLLVAKARQQS